MTDAPMASPPPAAIERLRSRLTAPRGARRIDELLALDDAAEQIAALAPPELFELVHEAGFEESLELLALATPEQVQGCLDLDAWDKDTYLAEAVRPWLGAILEAGYEKVGEVWAGLDAEARMLFLQRHAVVYDLSLGENPDDPAPGAEAVADDAPLMSTPDGFFVLRLLGDDETRRLTAQLIEDLYRADAALARHTIQGARAEPAAELEEMSYRWRAGRMADLGYVDFYDALELFRPIELDELALDESPTAELAATPRVGAPLPAKVAQEMLARSFLSRALAELADDEDAARIEAALLYLTNRVLAAARARPGQHEVVQRAAAYGSATLSLGLEAVARGEPRRGALALRQLALTSVFRAGYTLTFRLAKLALALAPRAATAEAPTREVVTQLASPRPLWPRQADDPPGTGVRPLESLADLRRASELLRALTQKIALAERLGVDLLASARAPEPRPSLEGHLRTALLRAAGGGALDAAPLTTVELERARRAAFAGGALTAIARERCHDAVVATFDAGAGPSAASPPLPDLPALIDDLLAQLASGLAAISDERADPRFVGELVLLAE